MSCGACIKTRVPIPQVYTVAPDYVNGVRDVINWMTAHSGVSFEELRPYLFLKQDGEAVDHGQELLLLPVLGDWFFWPLVCFFLWWVFWMGRKIFFKD